MATISDSNSSSENLQSTDKETQPDCDESKKSEIVLRHEWYQTDAFVNISLLLRGLKPLDVNVDFQDTNLVFYCFFEKNNFCIKFNLFGKISPSQSSWKQTPSKIEIKLKKSEGGLWKSLEKEIVETLPQPAYPTSSLQKKDWDKIVCNIKKEEEAELTGLAGDAAVNQLFQKIYADGNDEVRRAMNKSFMESGGTVLSTNWKDIKDKQTEVKPPDGMEFKKWDL